MAHQMAQEGALWPSNVIRLGPHWRNCKIAWANIVHAFNIVHIVHWMLALKNTLISSLTTLTFANLG